MGGTVSLYDYMNMRRTSAQKLTPPAFSHLLRCFAFEFTDKNTSVPVSCTGTGTHAPITCKIGQPVVRKRQARSGDQRQVSPPRGGRRRGRVILVPGKLHARGGVVGCSRGCQYARRWGHPIGRQPFPHRSAIHSACPSAPLHGSRSAAVTPT